MAQLRSRWLLLTSLAVTVIFAAAGPENALAVDIDGATPDAPAVAPGITGTPDPAVAIITTETTQATAPDSAGNPCATRSFERQLVAWPLNWPELAWFKMRTYWCWNGTIVTTHSTSTTGGVTSSGAASGWDYVGVISSGWHCYVAKGGTRPCSGNTEYAEGKFTDCVAKVGCIASWYPYIQEWENYHGGFFHN